VVKPVNKSLKSLVVVLLILSVLIAGCRQSAQQQSVAPDVEITLDVEPQPPVVGEALLRVGIRDADGSSINDAEVSVRGDMDHAGMVPVMGTAEEAPVDGQYLVPFSWTMGGDWFVTVTVMLPGGEIATAEFSLMVFSRADGD
jgi:hypothetical protein